MGLLDDLLYNASPDNGPGLLGYLNSDRTAHVADDAKGSSANELANALGLNDIGSTFQNVDPNNPGMTNAAPAAPAAGAPGAPSVPISSPVAAPQFGANASPYLFPQAGGLPAPAAPQFGANASPVPFPQAGGLGASVPPAVANANAQADDDEEDTPAAAPAAPASPIAVGGTQMPRIGSAAQFAPAANAMAQAPAAAPAPAPNFFNRAADALHSISEGGSLLGAVRGQYDDPRSLQTAQGNLTARALLAKGVDPSLVAAAVQPGNGELLKALFGRALGQGTHTQETDKDGNVWDVNKETGQRTIALAAKDDKFQHYTTKNFDGSETPHSFNTKTAEDKIIGNGAAPGAPGAPGFGSLLAQGATYDPNASGDAYMAQFSPEVQAAAKAYINGDVLPTGNPRKNSIATFAKTVATKYGQDMGIPVSDTTYGAKRTMKNQLASSSNSSMGGILSNGESSFSHLADATESMSELGNVSHDGFPFAGTAAHIQNEIGNAAGGSKTKAKILAVVDNLGKYGSESTKFYAGTGGGVEERTAARKDVDPNKVSGEEMAAFAAKEKSLMLDRLNTKFQEIRNTLGEEEGNREIAKHMPGIQKNIAKIDANIAKMRGEEPPAAASAAPATPKLEVGQSTTIGNTSIKRIN